MVCCILEVGILAEICRRSLCKEDRDCDCVTAMEGGPANVDATGAIVDLVVQSLVVWDVLLLSQTGE